MKSLVTDLPSKFSICQKGLITSIALALSSNSIAQQTPQADTDNEEEYEVVVVTAQKRTQQLSEVPIAISSFSASSIEQTGITQLTELADFIPNLSITRTTDFTSAITIRGVGANSRNIGFDTRVGVYLDGVYLGQSPALNQELLDLERVEVLRGPQGTLFGKNTVAGAINLISKKPSDELEGKLSASIGNMGAREIQGQINVPISDTSAAKFSVTKLDRDGYIKNLTTGNDLNERDALAYRGQFRSQLSDKLELNFSVDGLNTERLSFLGEAISDTLSTMLDLAAPEKDEVATTIDTFEKRDIVGGSLDLSYSMDNGYDIKSITAYRDTDIFYRNDSDYAAADLLVIEYSDQYEQWSQEFQFISPQNDSGLDYVAGLYLYRQDADTRRDAINGVHSFLFGNVPGSVVTNTGFVTTDSYAAYFNGGYDLSEDSSLALGLRYTDETKDLDWLLDGSASGIFGIGSTDGQLVDSRSDNYVSYALSFNHAFNKNLNGYAKYSTGFKSGGYNLDFITNADLAAGIQFDKETVGSAELGLKGNFYRNSLILNFAAFSSEFKNYQVNQFIDLGNGASSISIRNAAKANTQGIELEMTYRPISNLEIQASMGLLDTEFDSFPGGLTGGGNAEGKDLINAPDSNFSIGAQYITEISSLNADLTLRFDVTHSSGFFTTVDNVKTATLADGTVVDFGHVNSITLVNARIGLLGTNNGWEAYLWGRNLADVRDPTDNRKDFFGTVTSNYQEPRTYGVEVVYSF
ncbi:MULTISPECIES: TonB-dependent receptor [Alteromonadaceae]|uniref:TonB-dependent receptor n=1 Tax=Alteromonadaceae TaxID=72275 RepID=UPI001C096580|nr:MULTISPECIES: TonB-dependent receptor [Aliiglaciecola]MBU2877166.1 TonB-dependent receptor [Aliiglaciecola lipolytica]MDO6712096.1 TonB-dependent receptor [Aliiglaciecola sp. 2_MG-2023]MDO6753176.1 TonB-dependent receptor [Aliiglaciecola sp. 1_MG-2023]